MTSPERAGSWSVTLSDWSLMKRPSCSQSGDVLTPWVSRSASAMCTESSGGGGPIMYAADAAGKAASSAPPVQIGPVTVSAQVTVTFVYEA